MTEIAIDQALREAMVEVLEKMFFIEASGELPSDGAAEPSRSTSGSSCILVELTFEGDPSGVFRMGMARAAAALIAADFLGEDVGTLVSQQVDDVTKELANMICGAVLSRIESRATFRLAAPGLLPEDADRRIAIAGSVCAIETGSGILRAAIHMDTKACSSTARSAF